MISQLLTSYAPTLDVINNGKEIVPFYQGQLDVFCAIYAVLNALRISHNINALLARNILHETLTELALQPELFSSVLDQKTDYIFLVDRVLASASQIFKVNIVKPFTKVNSTPDNQAMHKACCTWLDKGPNRAVILRYLQYITPDKKPVNKHWTTVHLIENDILHFFDCSHKKSAIFQAKLSGYTTDPRAISSDCLLCFHPQAIRFIEPGPIHS